MDNDYIYPNYDVSSGDVRDGLIRIRKTDLQVEIYLHGQWNVMHPAPQDVIDIANSAGYTTSSTVTSMIDQTLGAVQVQLEQI